MTTSDTMGGEILAMLGWGLMNSVLLFLVAGILGIGLARVFIGFHLRGGLARYAVGGWIAVFQSLPLLVLLLLLHLGLPHAGIRLSGLAVAVIGLVCVFSAALAEAVLGAMRDVPQAEAEAAAMLGAPPWLISADIALPQAWRRARGRLARQGMVLARDTALASVVAMPELLHQALAAEAAFDSPAPLIAAALLYLAILLPARQLVRRQEARS